MFLPYRRAILPSLPNNRQPSGCGKKIMTKQLIGMLLTTLCATALCGCQSQSSSDDTAELIIQQSGPYSPQTKKALLRWFELAGTASKQTPNLQEAVDLSGQLVKLDPRAKRVFLDALAEPTLKPMAKVLARFSLQTMGLDATIAEDLEALTACEHELTTRLCAIELLGSTDGEQYEKALTRLCEDQDHQVRFVATRALAVKDPNYRTQLRTFWTQEETTGDEKVGIVLALAEGPAFDSLPVFHDVINNTTFGEPVRAIAVRALSQVGTPESLPALRQCEQEDQSEALRLAARTAIEAIEQRADAVER